MRITRCGCSRSRRRMRRWWRNLCTPAVSGGGADLIYRYLVEPRHAVDHSKRKSKNLTKNLIISLLTNIHKVHNSDHLKSLIADTLMYRHRMNSA